MIFDIATYLVGVSTLVTASAPQPIAAEVIPVIYMPAYVAPVVVLQAGLTKGVAVALGWVAGNVQALLYTLVQKARAAGIALQE